MDKLELYQYFQRRFPTHLFFAVSMHPFYIQYVSYHLDSCLIKSIHFPTTSWLYPFHMLFQMFNTYYFKFSNSSLYAVIQTLDPHCYPRK